MTILNVCNRIADWLHEAVDQCCRQRSTCRRLNAPRRDESILQRVQELLLPVRAMFCRFCLCQRLSDAATHVLNAAFVALGVFLDEHLFAYRLSGQRQKALARLNEG